MEENPKVEPTDDASLLKPKPKRQQSEKQKAVWAKAQQTRLDNAKLKKDALNKAKETIENAKNKIVLPTEKPPTILAKKPKQTPKIIYEEESEDEPQVIVVKKKKKKAPVIVQEESSSEEDVVPPPARKRIQHAEIQQASIQPKPIVRFF